MTSDLYSGLKYRSIGPTRGGRVIAVAGDPTDRRVFYFGSTGGGVWKTTDGGHIWRNVSDGYFKYASVGALTVAHSDPNVIYAGMGESTIRGNVSRGDGVYKSTDAGATWEHVGLEDTQNIGSIVVHPENPDLVYVAALGHVWGPNQERGVYRSKDGGETWEKVLFVSDKAGGLDLATDPSNPRIIFVSTWEAHRTPYSLESGGPGSGIYRTTDGGDTWDKLNDKPGMPEGILGKIGLAVAPGGKGRVWAIIEAEKSGLYRSDDGGESWAMLCDDPNIIQRPWYWMHCYADPKDPNTVWLPSFELMRSIDGGKTFQPMANTHADTHGLWFDPEDPDRMIMGNDGGACVSYDGAVSWSTTYNQITGEFYHVTTDTRPSYRVFGAQQDNTTMSIPHRSDHPAINFTEWEEVGGGESGYIAVRPDNPNIIFAGSYQGVLTRYDSESGHSRNINVWPEAFSGWEAGQWKYRFQWTAPTCLSPHDPNTLYTGGNLLFRSTDEGMSWEPISPDLTRADPETLGPSGGPITKDMTGAETYATIFAVAPSPVEEGVIWAGSDDGLIHVTRDGGENWENVTPGPDQLPEWALISIIEASPHDAAKAYVAATRYKSHDDRPYLLKTSDYGANWDVIVEGIPENEFTRVIREDPDQPGLLYAGTERGMWVSFNDGKEWSRLDLNLPVVPIHDFVIHGSDLVVATHGRSFWILDDVTPLRQIAQDTVKNGHHLFTPRDTVRWVYRGGFGHSPVEGAN
ncbi:MAG: WD40/YVTN/BNR-like repeat-containing protein, partial [Chloroflexota bacterium]